MIRDYLAAGGACLLLVDPTGRDEQPQLDALLAGYGLRAGRDLVVDPLSQSLVGDSLVPVAMGYGDHEITRDFTVISYFPLCRSVAVEPDSAAVGLVFTAPESFAETGFEVVEYDEDIDTPGPLTVGAALELPMAEDGSGGGRLVLVGDSDFATNAHFPQQGNGNLFLNAVNWLAGNESLISIDRPTSVPEPLDLTWAESRFLLVVAVFGYPLVILGLGLAHWRRRRKL
jgi:ABC-type uncharacterized transport system involved in gliding motility auxiliary subunit